MWNLCDVFLKWDYSFVQCSFDMTTSATIYVLKNHMNICMNTQWWFFNITQSLPVPSHRHILFILFHVNKQSLLYIFYIPKYHVIRRELTRYVCSLFININSFLLCLLPCIEVLWFSWMIFLCVNMSVRLNLNVF